MKTINFYFLLALFSFLYQSLNAQEEPSQKKIEALENLKDDVVTQEKEALKLAIERINKQQKTGDISEVEAKSLKESAAKKHALNIEDRLTIMDSRIELLKRNEGLPMTLDAVNYETGIEIDWGTKRADGDLHFGVKILKNKDRWPVKYDRRTYSDPVIAVGLNNAIIDGQSLEDSPYRYWGSKFFEMGWAWRTRVFKNSNALRIHYGLSFQFNGLKPKDNQFFVVENGQTELQEFESDLRKSKFRMDNLVLPVHFEFGPSKFMGSDEKIRYSLQNQFRIGIGGYGGINLGTKQKLKYKRDGETVKEKLKNGYNTSNFVYGLSAYIGFDAVQLYAKYDLNPIFKDALVEQRNISFGVRFDLD